MTSYSEKDLLSMREMDRVIAAYLRSNEANCRRRIEEHIAKNLMRTNEDDANENFPSRDKKKGSQIEAQTVSTSKNSDKSNLSAAVAIRLTSSAPSDLVSDQEDEPVIKSSYVKPVLKSKRYVKKKATRKEATRNAAFVGVAKNADREKEKGSTAMTMVPGRSKSWVGRRPHSSNIQRSSKSITRFGVLKYEELETPQRPELINPELYWMYDVMCPGPETVMQCSKFTNLPHQFRSKIIRFIPPAERLILQDVSRQIQFETRCRIGIAVKLCEITRDGPSFMRDVFVDTIYVSHFKRPIIHPNRLIFRPENIMVLKICSKVSLPVFDGFIQRCTRVKYLSVVHGVLEVYGPSPDKYPNSKVCWREMDIIQQLPTRLESLRELELVLPAKKAVEYFANIFGHLRVPNLKRLIVLTSGSVETTVTAMIHHRILSFLKQNVKIREVTLKTSPKISGTRGLTSSNAELRVDKSFANIRVQHIVLLELMVNFSSWTQLLLNQTHLQTYKVLHLTNWALQRRIIESNAQYLRRIAIHSFLQDHLSNNKSTNLDLAVFTVCELLEELYICLAHPVIPGHSDAINIQNLPKSLRILALRNVAIKTRDFLKFPQLPKITSIGLISLISPPGYEMSMEAVNRLLWTRSLNELAISDATPENFKQDVSSKTTYLKMFPVLDILGASLWLPNYRNKAFHIADGSRNSLWTIHLNDKGYRFKYCYNHRNQK